MRHYIQRFVAFLIVLAAVLLPAPGTALAEWSSAATLKNRAMSKNAFAHPGAWSDRGNPLKTMAERSEAAVKLPSLATTPEVPAPGAGAVVKSTVLDAPKIPTPSAQAGVQSGCVRRNYRGLEDHVESALPSKQKLFVVDEASVQKSPEVLKLVEKPAAGPAPAASAPREARVKYDDQMVIVTLPDGRVEQFAIPAPANSASIPGHAAARVLAMNKLVRAVLVAHERPQMAWAGVEKGYVVVNAAAVLPPRHTDLFPRRSREVLAVK